MEADECCANWFLSLPLDSVMLLISELLPRVQEMQASRHRATSTSAVVEYLGAVSLEHVLGSPPLIAPRRFMVGTKTLATPVIHRSQWSDSSVVWLTSLIWGEIYVRGMTPLGVWNGTNVRLFYVKHGPSQQRQLTEAVSNVVGGFWGRAGGGDPARPRG